MASQHNTQCVEMEVAIAVGDGRSGVRERGGGCGSVGAAWEVRISTWDEAGSLAKPGGNETRQELHQQCAYLNDAGPAMMVE
jgi:hypothetical protein